MHALNPDSRSSLSKFRPMKITLETRFASFPQPCSAVIYGVAVADPVALLAKANGGVLTTAVAMGGLLIATLSTNIAANIVAPANAFVNLAPSKLSFRLGGIVTAVLGTVICPWRLMADASGYIFVWLIGTFIGWFSYGQLN